MYGRWLRGYIRRSKAPYAVVLRAAKGVAIRFDQGWSQGSFVEAEAEVKAAIRDEARQRQRQRARGRGDED